MPCACAEETCRSGSISKNHQLTNLNKCGKFHACIRNSTILALSRLANINYAKIINLGALNKLILISIPVMEAHNGHSGAFLSIPVRSSPFLLLYAPCFLLNREKYILFGIGNGAQFLPEIG